MKEHKKLYKAGKRWLTATILTASSALLLAGATTVSAHASGDNGQSATTPAEQPATQPGGAASGSITTTTQETLPDIHDGNVTISGPDQNAAQRATMQANVNTAITTAQNDSAAADSARAAVVAAQNENDAANSAVSAYQAYLDKDQDLDGNFFEEKEDFFNGQQNAMNRRANRLDSQAEPLEQQANSLASQAATATGAQKASLDSQFQSAEAQYQSLTSEANMFHNRATHFMELGQHYSDARFDFSSDATSVLLNTTVANLQKFKDDVNNFINTLSSNQQLGMTAGDKEELEDFIQKIDNAIAAVKEANNHGFTTGAVVFNWRNSAEQQLQDKKKALNTAISTFTTSAHHETELQHALNALPIIRSAKKVVTRTITSNIPGSSPVTQTATVTGTATMNADDSAATSYKWTTPDTWAAYTVPDVDGYTHTQKTVAAQNVDGTTADTTVNVTYNETETDAHRYEGQVYLAPLTVNVNSAVPEPQLLNPIAPSATNALFASLYREGPSTYVTLPAGTTASWADPATVANYVKTVGNHTPTVLVSFPDGTSLTTLTEQLHVVNNSSSGTHNPGGTTTPTTPGTGDHSNPSGPTNPSSGTHNPGGTTTPTTPGTGDHSNPSGPTNPSSGTHTPGGTTTPTTPTNPGTGDHSNPSGPTNPSSGTHTPGGNTTPTNPSQPSSGNNAQPGTSGSTNPSNPSHPVTPNDQGQSEPTNNGENPGVLPGQPTSNQPGNTTPAEPGQTVPTNTNSGQGTNASQSQSASNNGETTNASASANNFLSAASLTTAQRAALNSARQALSAQQAARQSANTNVQGKLPQTGNHSNSAAALLGAFGTLLGLGFAAHDKKRLG